MSINVFRVCFLIVCVLCVHCQKQEGARCESEADKLVGKCVSPRRCVSTVYDIKTKKFPQICSFSGRDPVICCTDCELVNDTSNVLVDNNGFHYFKTGQKAADKCLEYTVSLPYPCHLNYGLRKSLSENEKCYKYVEHMAHAAVGGVDANRRQFPHMALLGYGDTLEVAQWLCGGSVISDRFILTAAHCLGSHAAGLVKFAALGILKRSDPPEKWQRYTVKRAIAHPEYKAPSKYHDIALLETETKINYNQDVLPACLHVDDDDRTISNGIATGWGALGYHQALSDTLQVVYLKKFTDAECSAVYPSHRNLINGYDNKTQFCYGEKFKVIDTCEGDSGGPLQVTTIHGTCIYQITGVTSYGRACGVLGGAGMYTRVKHYVPWIESIVWP